MNLSLALLLLSTGSASAFLPPAPAFFSSRFSPLSPLASTSPGNTATADITQPSANSMEVFLAELVFSTNDVRSDIMANYEKASTEAFRTFLTAKASESEDLEERAALKSLLQTVEETVRMVDLSNKAEERAQAARIEEDDERMRQANLEDKPAAMSSKDVLAQADNIDGVGVTASNAASAAASQAAPAASFLESEVSPEIMESYRPLLAQLLPPYAPGSNVVDAVKEKYEETDAQLLKILAAMPGADAQAVLDAIGDEQQKRIAAATELLRAVLGAGSVERMEGEIVKLSREDKIDESFLLLLEANAEQAKAAGALDAEAVMRRLKVKADKEKDRSTKAVEVRLLRQLLRETDEKKREVRTPLTRTPLTTPAVFRSSLFPPPRSFSPSPSPLLPLSRSRSLRGLCVCFLLSRPPRLVGRSASSLPRRLSSSKALFLEGSLPPRQKR